MTEPIDVVVPHNNRMVKVGAGRMVGDNLEVTFEKSMFTRYTGTIANLGLIAKIPGRDIPGKHSEEKNKEKTDD